MKKKSIDNNNINNNSDRLLKYLAFIYDFNFNLSLKLARNKYLDNILLKMNRKSNLQIKNDVKKTKEKIYRFIKEGGDKNEVFSINR